LVFLLIANSGLASDKPNANAILANSGVSGGFVVHVGCGDEQLTAALRASDAYVVHGLDTDAKAVETARKHFAGIRHNGKLSAAVFDGKHLPYIGNTVNLIVIRDSRHAIREEELTRVLAPKGKVIAPEGTRIPHPVSRSGNGFVMFTKPLPCDIDEWTHYLHDADNNAVSQDAAIVAPLSHLQWNGGPRYSRHHDKSSSIPALVSAAGRVFYIVDEGPRASILWGADWQLIARDAFNGVVLWRKEIEQWTSHLWPLKSGPSKTPRRLVAVNDAVYVTLGLLSPVSKLDAATGDVLKEYAGTEQTEEIILKDGVLYLVVHPTIDPDQRGGSWEKTPKTVMAVREADGAVLWKRNLPWIAPVTLTVGEKHVYVCDGPRVIAFDRVSGDQLWRSNELPWRDKKMPTYFAPTLVSAGASVLYVGGENWHEHAGSKGLMTCLDAATGQVKWQRPHLPSGYQSPQDVFVIDDLVWCGSLNSKPGEFDKRYPDVSPSTGEFIAYDLDTGKLAKTIPRGADCYWFHHRCYRAKATESLFLTSRTGIEMIDIRSGEWSLHHWVRGACLYGIMPANGLVYAPPHPCACYPEAKLSGFNALAGSRSRSSVDDLTRVPRLHKGPAYENLQSSVSSLQPTHDWPTFRGNAARSGSTTTKVGSVFMTRWETEIGGRLSQPVVADGTVLVAAVDDHAVHAIDQQSGNALWTFVAGGRIDSPPTIYQGSALFGSADGYVYCLRASDGTLAWRFRAAPYDQRLMSYGQLESVWPVHGSVLIRNDVAYIVAGRSMFLDGGLTLYRLDPRTGDALSMNRMDEQDPATGEDLHRHVTMLDMPVASSDILSSEGEFLFMRSQPFDLEGRRMRVQHTPLSQQQGDDAHLFVPNGFLDDNWWHRAFWVYGRSVQGGPGYAKTGHSAPSGKMMVLDRDNLYIFGRQQKYWRWTTPLEFRLFCVDRRLPVSAASPATGAKPKRRKASDAAATTRWSIKIPVLVRAMVKAGDTIFAAGPPDTVDEESAVKTYDQAATRDELRNQANLFAGEEGSVLWAVAAKDGSKIQETKLDVLPVFDGMIAADGKIFMTTIDGKVLCLQPRSR